MARTNIPLSTLVPNGGLAAPAGTAIDVANGMNAQFPSTGLPAGNGIGDALLWVNNTFAGTKVVTSRAGVGGGTTPGAAYRSGLGDLTFTVPASSAAYIGPL